MPRNEQHKFKALRGWASLSVLSRAVMCKIGELYVQGCFVRNLKMPTEGGHQLRKARVADSPGDSCHDYNSWVAGAT